MIHLRYNLRTIRSKQYVEIDREKAPLVIFRAPCGPVQMHPWADLASAMKFIGTLGQLENPDPPWVKHLLDSLSTAPTRAQLVPILNGYADLYQMMLYFIPCNDQEVTDQQDIATYEGISSQTEQTPHYQRIGFIMFNFERSSFAPLYIIDEDNRPRTLFNRDDQNILDHVGNFIWMHNGRRHFWSNLCVDLPVSFIRDVQTERFDVDWILLWSRNRFVLFVALDVDAMITVNVFW